ncbi:MAG: reverse transcriptase family protein [Candidatus Ornithomonoglobus sp.]
MEIYYEDTLYYYEEEIAEILKNKNKFYHCFEIVKKNGGKRTIAEPLFMMKQIQRVFLEEFFYPKRYLIHKNAYAYIPKVSLHDCIEKHVGKALVVKMDIKNFFGSITDSLVYDSLKYTFQMEDETARTVTELCTLNGALPQGAVTSPILSNFVCRILDKRLYTYCSRHGIEYSRYADDLIFSGSFDVKALIGYVSWALRDYYGFKPNYDKLKILHSYQRQVVLGVLVNQRCRLTKEKRHELRQLLYYTKKYGVESCLKYSGYNIQSLKGYLNYALSIDNEPFIKELQEILYSTDKYV